MDFVWLPGVTPDSSSRTRDSGIGSVVLFCKVLNVGSFGAEQYGCGLGLRCIYKLPPLSVGRDLTHGAGIEPQ